MPIREVKPTFDAKICKIEYAQTLHATHDATIRTHIVQVNEAAVNQLQLPVHILHGTVRKFRVSIPWASLDRNPVKVEIDGVYLLLGPVSKEDWAADEVRSRRLKIKRGQVAAAEKEAAAKSKRRKKSAAGGASTGDAGAVAAAAAAHDDEELSAKDKGYLARLVQRIIDNLEVTVKNVHLRYEDAALAVGESLSGTSPSSSGTKAAAVAAAGVILDEFVICSTDGDFRRVFVDRTKSNASTLVHKVSDK
jgi:vacuolar protein sorting-associated protein 13A/C